MTNPYLRAGHAGTAVLAVLAVGLACAVLAEPLPTHGGPVATPAAPSWPTAAIRA